MKITTQNLLARAALLLALVSTLNLQLSTASAQGSLTPPGVPAPTMKSLDQIEARTPISSAPYTITNPGSYYLTANVSVNNGNAITIAANGVTLDLNGFTISSTAASATGYAVLLSGAVANVDIHNGHISSGVTNNSSGVFSGGGFNYGISESTADPNNVRVRDVSVTGVQNYGIYIGFNATVVESCVVNMAGAYGIAARSVSDSTALNCGVAAINGTAVNNCCASGVGTGWGISGSVINNCFATSTGGTYTIYAQNAQNSYGNNSGGGIGLYAVYNALNCYGTSSSGDGLDSQTALNCYGYSGGDGNGLYAGCAQNCYGYSFDGTGIKASIANSCYGTTQFSGGMYLGSSLNATIANSCLYTGLANVSYPYNMPY